jgi:hypothetical protein
MYYLKKKYESWVGLHLGGGALAITWRQFFRDAKILWSKICSFVNY